MRKLTVCLGDEDVALPDPYSTETGWFVDLAKIPCLSYHGLYNYLIKTPGPFTGEKLEAYKSLEAYNMFTCGHVSEVRQHNISEHCPHGYVKARVLPSQRPEDAYKPWVLLDKKHRYIVTSHCTCTAGQGLACSHVAALLFAIEAVTHRERNKW